MLIKFLSKKLRLEERLDLLLISKSVSFAHPS
jgi:hypothetical protein